MHDDIDRGHLGTGIRDLKAAKRYLKRKFSQGKPETVVVRPGARFYVTVRAAGNRVAYLLGPYVSHMTALTHVPRARRMLAERWGTQGRVLSIGTASRPSTVETIFGR